MGSVNRDRIEMLREAMKRSGIDAYMIPTADFHNSEYAADYFHTREFFSGFTGSAGTLVVRAEEACLWTDGRYFIQAAAELEGSGVTLMKMGEPGVPTIREYLSQNMQEGSVLGFDGRCVPSKEGREFEKLMKGKKGSLKIGLDLAEGIWKDRPPLPCHPVMILDEDYTGEDVEAKLGRLRDAMHEKGAAAYIDSKLDNIMWLLNMRGSDVTCNPVALTHILVDERNVYLFIQDGEVTPELRSYAALHRISILPYDDLEDFLAVYDHSGDLMCDPDCVSYSVYLAVSKGLRKASSDNELIKTQSPLAEFKSVKNDVEMANIRECYKYDSAALCRFIMWLTDRVGKTDMEPVTESGAAAYLDNLRSEIDDYMDLSFPTISAYGPNAAMMHYEAVPGVSDAELKPEGMLLVDSGGQYLTGTTDVTRTISLGPVTEEMKKHYTLTAVSETPPSIRWKVFPGRQDAPLQPGMIVSDEPGVYLEGKYGIRIETILEVVEHTTNEWGSFLAFEPLTLVPFDTNLIDPAYLTPDTRKLLNEYHERVRTELMPLMDAKEQEWLILQTEPV